MNDKTNISPTGSTKNRQSLATDLEPKLRLARLIRRSAALGLSRDTWEILRQRLFERLEIVTNVTLNKAHTKNPPVVKGIENLSLESLNSILRGKVNSGARWREMEATAWERLEKQPDVEVAASIVELAYLHGSLEDAGVALERVRKIGPAFYIEIHSGVREKLCGSLWDTRFKGAVADLVFKERENPALLPIEKRLLFLVLAKSKDPSTPWLYFRSFQREILDSTYEPTSIELNTDLVLIKAAKVGLELGDEEVARELLDLVPRDSIHRDEALQALLSINYESKFVGEETSDSIVNLVKAEGDWRERIRILHGFLLNARDSIATSDRNRASINELLRNPLLIVPKTEESWRYLSALLVSFRDLEQKLPNLFQVFKQNATQFHSPALDFSLWVPFLDEQELTIDIDKTYWTGVAKLHQYVAQGIKYESCLWQARDLVSRAAKGWARPLPVQWKDLLHSASIACANAPHNFEYDRQMMLKQTRIATDLNLVAIGDVEEYLRLNDNPSLVVLNELVEFARIRKAESLEFRLILIRAKSSHLTNLDLDSCWRVAVGNNCWDEAWRTATILNTRGSLNDQVRCAWEMSGEKRSRYGFHTVRDSHFQACLSGLSAPIARLINASVSVGPKLPELLAILDSDIKTIKRGSPNPKSLQGEVELFLAKIPWLPAQAKTYISNNEMASVSGAQLPAFVNVLPQNIWSYIVLNLCDRLGINAWDWRLSHLSSMIADLVPRMTSVSGVNSQSSKVARRLRDFTPDQRNAWQEIAGLSRVLSDEDAHIGFAQFVCRLATVIYQSHFEALTSLHQMRAPISLIWDLEQWIVSDGYSKVRSELGSGSRVPVPTSLKLTGVVAKNRQGIGVGD